MNLFQTLTTISFTPQIEALWVLNGPIDKVADNECYIEMAGSGLNPMYPLEAEEFILFARGKEIVKSWHEWLEEFKPWQFPDWDRWQHEYRKVTGLGSSGATMQDIRREVIEKCPEFAKAQIAAYEAWCHKAYRVEWANKQIDQFKVANMGHKADALKKFEVGIVLFIDGKPRPDSLAEAAGWDYGKATTQLKDKYINEVVAIMRSQGRP